MVRAWVELVCMGDCNAVSYLNFSSVCPLVHEITELKRAIHSLVMKLFLVNLIFLVLESQIDPIE